LKGLVSLVIYLSNFLHITDLPDYVTYLLIGGGTASYSAAKKLKDHCPKSKILIIGEEANLPYSRPPLSKQLWMDKDGPDLKFKGRDGKPARY
jgi:programmed cell death 8 (apoptosis-inducing factor)